MQQITARTQKNGQQQQQYTLYNYNTASAGSKAAEK